MRLTKIYAEALLESLKEDQKISALTSLRTLSEDFHGLDGMINFLIQYPHEFAAIKEVLSANYSNELVNFIEVLVQDGLVDQLSDVTQDYCELLIERDLYNRIRVTSAHALDQESEDKILEMIEAQWPQPYEISYQVDAGLIGGLRIEVNQAVIDTSFKSRLEQIKQEVV